jgi:hypothetical protein
MKYFNLYRITAYLLLIFCALHTFGVLRSHAAYGQEAGAVLSAMKSVHFEVMGASCSYYGFYLGFGLLFSVFLLFSAAVSWHLGGLGPDDKASSWPIAWALFFSQVLVTILSWAYFFIAPVVTSTLITILLGITCVKKFK